MMRNRALLVREGSTGLHGADSAGVPVDDSGTGTGTGTRTGEMIFVPAGPFTMGSDSGGQEDEHPAHTVTLSAYWLDTTEVTNEAYERCVAAWVCRARTIPRARSSTISEATKPSARQSNPSAASVGRRQGILHLARQEASDRSRVGKSGAGHRRSPLPLGRDPPDSERGVYATSRTAEVGSKPKGAGPYGHLDMAGNVWEWLEDIYDPYAYRRPGADRGVPGSCDQVLAAQNELRQKGLQGFTGSQPHPHRMRARAARRSVQLRRSRAALIEPRAPPGTLPPHHERRALREGRVSGQRIYGRS